MAKTQLIPARHIETTLTERNSRFLTNAGPVFSVDQAHAFIESIKGKYSDASHHVPAYLIGHGSSIIAHCSDAGEPSGTAGRPVLSVLKGSGLGDIAIVVTRYFGGTKLGTGGLVRAYSDSARQVLDALPLAKKLATTGLMFVVPYPLYEQAKIIINCHKGDIRDEVFSVDVTLTVRVADGLLDSFKSRMTSLTRGNIEFIVIAHSDNTIMPLR